VKTTADTVTPLGPDVIVVLGPGGGGAGFRMNVAVVDLAAVMLSVQVLPKAFSQSSLQPPKLPPPVGVAVRVTAVPSAKLCEQSVPQSIPAGEEVTVPVPLPSLNTDRVRRGPTCVVSVSELLAEFGSDVALDTTPAPLTEPVTAELTGITNSKTSPLPTPEAVHVAVFVVSGFVSYMQPMGGSPSRETPEVTVSLTTTLLAGSGPPFDTDNLYS
jgi:hypothetical protein